MTLTELMQNGLAAMPSSIIKDTGDEYTACLMGTEVEASMHCIFIVQAEDCVPLLYSSGNAVFAIGSADERVLAAGNATVVLFSDTVSKQTLYAEVTRMLREDIEFHQAAVEMTNIFLKQHTLHDFVEQAENVLNRPIAVFDPGSGPIELGPRFQACEKDAVISNYREAQYISSSFAQNNQFVEFLKELNRHDQPFTFCYSEHLDGRVLPRRVHKIFLGDSHIAHCSVLLERELSEFDDRLIAFICKLLSMDLERNAYSPYHNDFESVVLKKLLYHQYRSEKELLNLVKIQNWKLFQNFYALLIPRRSSPELPSPETPHYPLLMIRAIQQCIPTISPLRHYVEDDRILLLIDLKDPGREKEMQGKIDSLFRTYGIACFMSARFPKLMEFGNAINDVEKLLAVADGAAVRNGLINKNTLYFQRISFCLNAAGMDDLCPTSLESLYQTEQGYKLIKTTYTYLDKGKNVQKTAECMGIHRNTVVRRLARFEELTGMDIERGEDACKLYLSERLWLDSQAFR